MDLGPADGGDSRAGNGLRRDQRRAVSRDSLAAPLLQFFATSPVACPYVPGRAERKLLVELDGRSAALVYDDLSRAGFRRSHHFAYRPACRGCSACVPVRIAVDALPRHPLDPADPQRQSRLVGRSRPGARDA